MVTPSNMNPYSVLGLKPSASADDIRKAYRKIAKKHHPDLNPGNTDAEKKFKELNTANEILSDPEKRAAFDRGDIDESGNPLHQAPPHSSQSDQEYTGPFYRDTQQGGSGGAQGSGRYTSAFEGIDPSMFEELFGRRGGGGMGARQPRDEQYSMEVSFKDAAIGAEKEITIPSGKKLKVKIPAGIESGKKLRFKGAGGNKESGIVDIYIEIVVKPSKLFTRKENNIELELPVTLYEAILGGEVTAPSLEGSVKVKIPAGSRTGTKLRLRGKGVGGATRGDLIITLHVILPTTIDESLSAAIKEWSTTHQYNPRSSLPSDGDI